MFKHNFIAKLSLSLKVKKKLKIGQGLCYFMPGRRDSRRRDNGIGINGKTLSLAVLTLNVP